MVDAAAVTARLGAAGLAFGPPPATPAALRWGPLFDALDDGHDDDYVTAVELIYEGYLLHYRHSRVIAAPASARETTLLAGDFFYARGLRLIAARGDTDAVGLLARLMTACSQLRSVGGPFADDDALWAFTMGGLAALRRGTPAATVAGLFERFDAAAAGGAPFDVRRMARAEARRLKLRDAAPLERELSGDGAAGLRPSRRSAGSAAARAAGR
ncbi:MAG: hypothetical protein NTX16_07655 [Actinobacteria bacterium]|nr:hypothetical protein [Actinomycetota bacterium]